MSLVLIFIVHLVKLVAYDQTPTGTAARIAKVVDKHMSSMRLCYQRAARHEPTLVAKLYTHLTIESTGKVASVSFSAGSSGVAELGSCMAQAIKTWQFPKQTTSYEYEFPFIVMRQ